MPDIPSERGTLQRLSQTFLVGLFGILPLGITFAVLAWIIVLVHNIVGPYSPFGTALRKIGLTITACEVTAYILGVIGTIAMVYGLGVLIGNGVGPRWHSTIDASMRRVPLISTVYDASKNLTRVLNRENSNVQGMSPVMCHFGENGAAAIPALMPTPEVLHIGGNAYHIVIIPSAPVPFGGALLCVKAEWVKQAECSIEELIGIYMSMGASAPECLGKNRSVAIQQEAPQLRHS